MLAQLVLVVIGVCGLAYLLLRYGLKRLVSPDRSGGVMEVVSRLPVEPRRSILVVRIGERHLVIGSSEAGFTQLAELDEWPDTAADAPRSFRDILGKGRADNPLEEASS
jgi:flagellar biosynthetic protein FliO